MAGTRARTARAGQHSQTQWRTWRGGNAERGATLRATDSAQGPKVKVNATGTPTVPRSRVGCSTFGAAACGRSQQAVSQGRSGFWGVGVGAAELRTGTVGRQQPEHPLLEHALPGHAGDLAGVGVGAESGTGPQHSPAVAPQHHPGGSANRTPHASARTRLTLFNATPGGYTGLIHPPQSTTGDFSDQAGRRTITAAGRSSAAGRGLDDRADVFARERAGEQSGLASSNYTE